MGREFPISEALLNEILQYLGNRPYVEVAIIIQKIGKVINPSVVVPFKKAEGEGEPNG